jgi:hypothetical protein
MKFRGVISLRKLLPTWAMPNGTFWRLVSWTWAKSTNIAWAVSGRIQTWLLVSSVGPTKVLNMRLNAFGSVSASLPQLGHSVRPSDFGVRWSARKRWLHSRHSTSGSVNPPTWPEASQTRGCMRIDASSCTMSSRSWIIRRFHASLTLSFSAAPSGPKSQAPRRPP